MEYATQTYRNGEPKRFSANLPNMAAARKEAAAYLADGYHQVAILKRQPLPPGHSFGAAWLEVVRVGV